ncbi:MAG: hypothetical protein ACFFEN_05910 [Candidatus Thorarchaeota archaeon]
MVENEENVLTEDNHPKKKFITTWRNKWITSRAGSIDDFIATYEALAEKMRCWKEAVI